MPHFLQSDSSTQLATSITRQLTAEFATHWQEVHTGGVVTYRDLGTSPIPHLSEATISAMFLPLQVRSAEQTRATALQEELIAELATADTVVIGAPMHNFSIPSGLKAWIDHVVVFRRTVGRACLMTPI